jgi:hypothetical protein
MEEIKDFASNLYYPPRKRGVTTIVMINTTFMDYPFSENEADAIQAGVLKAKMYEKEGRQGVKVFVFNHSTGGLKEIDHKHFF